MGGIGKEENGQDVVICELWIYHKKIQIDNYYIHTSMYVRLS